MKSFSSWFHGGLTLEEENDTRYDRGRPHRFIDRAAAVGDLRPPDPGAGGISFPDSLPIYVLIYGPPPRIPGAPVTRTQSRGLIRVCLQVLGKGEPFTVTAQAASIRRAEDLVKSMFPGGETSVLFPIEGDDFFADAETEGVEAARATAV